VTGIDPSVFRGDLTNPTTSVHHTDAVNRQLRKIIKTRGQFPTEDAALKLLWLALIQAEKKWSYPIRDWPGNAGPQRDLASWHESTYGGRRGTPASSST